MSTDIFMLDILLDRAESHPEEFGASGKWVSIIDHYDDCMTEEEKKKVTQALYKARRARFNEALMKALAGEEEPSFNFSFNTANRPVWGATSISNLASKVAEDSINNLVVERIKELNEEREMDAMYEYYKRKGETE